MIAQSDAVAHSAAAPPEPPPVPELLEALAPPAPPMPAPPMPAPPTLVPCSEEPLAPAPVDIVELPPPVPLDVLAVASPSGADDAQATSAGIARIAATETRKYPSAVPTEVLVRRR
ncbi:MAG: hypothetical protein EXR75_10865 [Myxococcales bacterium]|nr:hypothetical protein [Myxococcales bacterium]